MSSIADNIKKIKEKTAEKLISLGRPEDDLTIVAVTKTHPVEVIEEALRNGISHIGENKVQEAIHKIPFITVPYEGFHFIGHLQSNKINNLLKLKPMLIQSIDSLYIAQQLNRSLGRKNITQDILIQVNTTAETTKSGVNPENAIDMIWQIAALPCLNIKGLMTIGMLSPNPENTRPYFRKLWKLKEKIEAEKIPEVQMKYISMGMSEDYLIALEEGSNMLRLGTIIFGTRNYGGTN